MDFDWVDKKAFELVAVQETIKGISLSLNNNIGCRYRFNLAIIKTN